jgi:uncharacterized membrane protein
MNPAQLHLLFTHLPIVGLGFAILINIYALVKRNEELHKLSLWTYVILGVFALIAYLTGDDAGKLLVTYPGITQDVIEPHENLALLFFISLMITSGLAIISLYFTMKRKDLIKRFSIILLVLSLLISILAIKTGSTGGAIRHIEIKQGAYKVAK